MDVSQEILDWLMTGDVSIQYQTKRDLLGKSDNELRLQIAERGWGKEFLSKRNTNGHWGKSFYNPKWISTHYTLLDLKNLGIVQNHPAIQATIEMLLNENKAADGGMNPIGSIRSSDVCINGMFLNYATYFRVSQDNVKSIVDFLLNERMPDGGFNCRSNRSGARHSSLHSTISVLEGINEYTQNDYKYRIDELWEAQKSAIEFILLHQLYLSDRTGKIIHKDFLKLSYPSRWKYDILRALDFFQNSNTAFDERMKPSLDVLNKKRNKDGTWNVQAKHPGKIHFEMEKPGKPSRLNTLRAFRVLKHFSYQ